MKCTVIIHTAEEGGYWAEVPALPGCFSQGKTVKRTLQNIGEAIDLHIEVLQEEGEGVFDLRRRLSTFEDDWNAPGMEAYDDL